jgi:hypothetical protein
MRCNRQAGRRRLEALHERGNWNIIAISRDVNGANATNIAAKNIPVLEADLIDKASLNTCIQRSLRCLWHDDAAFDQRQNRYRIGVCAGQEHR